MDQIIDLSDWIFNGDVDISEGLVANNSGSSLKVTGDYADTALEVSTLSRFASSVVTINASDFSGALDITGNGNGNVIVAAQGGGNLYGAGSSDKLYGGDGNDVFVHAVGNGRDSIYYYDDGDVVSVNASVTKSNLYNLGNGRIGVVFGNDTLMMVNASVSAVAVRSGVGEVESEETFDLAGMRFGAALNNVTLGAEYGDSDFDAEGYARLNDINAVSLDSEIVLLGNSNNNAISIGAGGGVLDGKGGNDKLVGNSGGDIFVHSVGNDTIVNYDGESDVVSLEGVTSLGNSDFLSANSGRVYLFVGNDTVTFYRPEGVVNVRYGVEDDQIEFNFDPSGMYFNLNRTAITLTSDYPDSDFNAADYAHIEIVDASRDSLPICLIGNYLDNRMSIGAGGGTMDGGARRDSRLRLAAINGSWKEFHYVGRVMLVV